jgi:hypothetical protein
MDGILIATTRNADLQTLGTGGQRTIHAWDQIVGYVRRTLGPEHAALFAEPNQDPDRGVTDWYGVGDGTVGTLSTLEPGQREAVTATLSRLHGDIREVSEKLRQSVREDERFLGEMLALALVTPGTEYTRVIGEQPVLVAWGHAPINAALTPELLIGHVPRAGVGARAAAGTRPAGSPMRIVGPPAARASNAWKYLLGAVLLACLLLALPFLALMLDPGGWFRVTAAQCVVSPTDVSLIDELRTEAARESRLREGLARVALELGNRRTACPPRPAPAPVPPPAPSQTGDANRAHEAGARTGKLQIILAWDDIDDLDLIVVCPDGKKIFFDTKTNCGGTLDVDKNSRSADAAHTPVENVVFERDPDPGRYRIFVLKYAHRGGAPERSPFRVTVRQEGQPDRVSTGTVGPNQQAPVEPVIVTPR